MFSNLSLISISLEDETLRGESMVPFPFPFLYQEKVLLWSD